MIYHYNYTENSVTHSKLTLKKIKDFNYIDQSIAFILNNSDFAYLTKSIKFSKSNRCLDQWRSVLINRSAYTDTEFIEIRNEISKQTNISFKKNFKNLFTYFAIKSSLISYLIIKLKGEK